MGLESATYINGLSPSNPGAGDQASQGDDHIRLVKQVLQNTFPSLNQPVTFTSFGISLNVTSAGEARALLDVPGLGEDNTFTGTMTLDFSDDGAGPQYLFDLRSASASPADGDELAEIREIGANSAAEDIVYAALGVKIENKTEAAESGEFYVRTAQTGVLAKRFIVGAGAYTLNAAAGDKGVDTINAKHYYKDGVELPTRIVVQEVHTADGEVDTTTTTFTLNDSVPQNTGGKNFIEKAITPTSATNTLRIDITVCFENSSATNPSLVALFQDSTADALRVAPTMDKGDSGLHTVTFTHWMTAGTTSETTFKVHIGSLGAGTITFNGSGSSRLFGGTLASSITITEYLAS